MLQEESVCRLTQAAYCSTKQIPLMRWSASGGGERAHKGAILDAFGEVAVALRGAQVVEVVPAGIGICATTTGWMPLCFDRADALSELGFVVGFVCHTIFPFWSW